MYRIGLGMQDRFRYTGQVHVQDRLRCTGQVQISRIRQDRFRYIGQVQVYRIGLIDRIGSDIQDRFRYSGQVQVYRIGLGVQDRFDKQDRFRYTGQVQVYRIGSGIKDRFRYTGQVQVYRIGSGIQDRFSEIFLTQDKNPFCRFLRTLFTNTYPLEYNPPSRGYLKDWKLSQVRTIFSLFQKDLNSQVFEICLYILMLKF